MTSTKIEEFTHTPSKNEFPFFFSLTYSFIVVMSGVFTSWYRLAQLSYCEIIAMVYFVFFTICCIYFSIVEMSSVLPFSTGAAGFTRVSLGSFWGFTLGIAEFIQGVFFICITLDDFAIVLFDVFGIDDLSIKIVIFAITLLVMFSIRMVGFKFAYGVSYFCGVLVVILWFIYIINDIIRLKDNLDTSIANLAYGHSIEFIFRRAKNPLWFFFNLSVLPVHCRRTENPKENVPKIILYTLLFTFFISFITITLYYLNGSDATFHPNLVLSGQFVKSFFSETTDNAHILLVVFALPLFFNMFTFYISQSISFSALAESGYVPSIFCFDPETQLPTWKVELFQVLFYFGISCFALFGDEYHDLVFPLLAAATFLIYFLSMVACYVFLYKFSSLKRDFRSPLGIYGTGYACVFTLFLFIASFVYDPYKYFVLYFFGAYLVVIAIVYNFYARRNLKFSVLEQKTLFAAYVINANVSRHQRKKLTKLNKEKKIFELQIQYLLKKLGDFLAFLADPWHEEHEFEEGIEIDSDIIDHGPSIPSSMSNTSDGNSELDQSITGTSGNTNRKNTLPKKIKIPPRLDFLSKVLFFLPSTSKVSPTAADLNSKGDIESGGVTKELFISEETQVLTKQTEAQISAYQTVAETTAEVPIVIPANQDDEFISKDADSSLNRDTIYLE